MPYAKKLKASYVTDQVILMDFFERGKNGCQLYAVNFLRNFLQRTHTICPVWVNDPPITVHLNVDDFVQIRHYLRQFSFKIFGE
jgi:hypothetical protein